MSVRWPGSFPGPQQTVCAPAGLVNRCLGGYAPGCQLLMGINCPIEFGPAAGVLRASDGACFPFDQLECCRRIAQVGATQPTVPPSSGVPVYPTRG